jgi:hypothetical protein
MNITKEAASVAVFALEVAAKKYRDNALTLRQNNDADAGNRRAFESLAQSFDKQAQDADAARLAITEAIDAADYSEIEVGR